MRSPAVFLCLIAAAACSDLNEEVGSATGALCNCDQDPQPCCCLSPILIDVAGDGFRLTSSADGVLIAPRAGYQRTERAWTEPDSDDAWLVLDRNGDGTINDISEMFGNKTPQPQPPEGHVRNGFLALAQYDDGDGTIDRKDTIDRNDTVFAKLRLWQDVNHDGNSQPEELHELPALGVAGLSVAYSEDRHPDGQGNLFRFTAAVRGTPGSKVGPRAWDVWLTGVKPVAIEGVQRSQARVMWLCTAWCQQTAKPPYDPNLVCQPPTLTGIGSWRTTRDQACVSAKSNCESGIDMSRCAVLSSTCNRENCVSQGGPDDDDEGCQGR
jgi:hypothetical protein